MVLLYLRMVQEDSPHLLLPRDVDQERRVRLACCSREIRKVLLHPVSQISSGPEDSVYCKTKVLTRYWAILLPQLDVLQCNPIQVIQSAMEASHARRGEPRGFPFF